MKNQYVIFVLIAVVFGGAGFYGGTLYQKSQSPAGRFSANGQFARGQFPSGSGRPGGRNFTGNGRPVTGQITDISNNNMTVKMPDGSSKIVLLTDSTKVLKTDSADKSELKNGVEVTVIGTTNSDGSVSGESVMIGTGFLRNMASPSPTAQ